MTIIKTSQIRNNGSVTNNKRLGSSPFPPGRIDCKTGSLHALK